MSKLDKYMRIEHNSRNETPEEMIATIRELNQEILDFLSERAKLRATLDKARKVIREIEYIPLTNIGNEDLLNELTPAYYSQWTFCPLCGYKKPDGHWKDCELGAWLEEYKETP